MAGEEGPGEGAGQQERRVGGGGHSCLVSNPGAQGGVGGASLECFQMFPGCVCNFLLSSPSHPLGLPAACLA